ncbi:excinuclease ABC subunit A [Alkalispirillum mobile]|uniref:UvrABC system protein A n=1 Tax=Alkalispirillum mobile TaxID=85925 RepID=A0A498C166_9GAMM|nr:excinuclease ABC subunit UvrA [Alkalispirillum mobile]RLK46850.1 excinuclease ABC subunit A [Alkalispirillum mobile]
MSRDRIRVRGARQNNLRGFDLDIPLGELVVVTGVSGSGKSSLAFDTVYAEGQRRYVETFSPYARQFLDRMDRPAVDRIDGVLPAIAIDQTNPVRTSRSTVGTMTELNDHLKLLFARTAQLYCGGCGKRVQRDTPEGVAARLLASHGGERAMVTARVAIPKKSSAATLRELLTGQGFTRIHAETRTHLEVVTDRIRLVDDRRDRLVEALESGLKLGQGHVQVRLLDEQREPGEPLRYSADLHCADCDIHYEEPTPGLFSFNSPVGACETCRGFGRVMGIDYRLVIPDESLSLEQGAIKPFQSGRSAECQDDLLFHARRRGVATDIPFRDLPEDDRRWIIEGEGKFNGRKWYGIDGYFNYLERKSYKMHVRVLLSRYRSYDPCPDCHGARLKPAALLWRIGSHEDSDAVIDRAARQRPHGATLPEHAFHGLPGLHLHDLLTLPLDRCARFFEQIHLPAPLDEAAEILLEGIHNRLAYLNTVGLGYLTLDRQSRTLSGGEVQRINLTTALGTALVNTLFVLDEPSIGLHPRDIDRIVTVMHRLRDAGNSLLVVEHDPAVMQAADRIIDIGPGPGERGGQVIFNGTPAELLRTEDSLTADYLTGRKRVVEGVLTGGAEHADADGSGACSGRNRSGARVEGSTSDHEGSGGVGGRVRSGARTQDGEGPQGGRMDPETPRITIQGATEHNLKALTVDIPVHPGLVCLTGVSGSGKSTLMRDILYNELSRCKGHPGDPSGAFEALTGDEHIDDVVLVDQSPIGKTTRSNPASYTGAFEPIRKAYAAEPLAKERKYTPGVFSFNSGKGRCPTCGGNGFEHVEMQFLSDVYLRCADCDGRRYRPEILEIQRLPDPGADLGTTADGPKNIAEVLDLTVDQAAEFFRETPAVLKSLEPLQAVGLGYLKLGQPVPTLSGGEAQRLKLAGHLAKTSGRRKQRQRLLFLFDEPTTGLHFQDVAVLLSAFRRLQDEGHALLVIEHNLDVMLAADWLIDLGPEGGDQGGRLLCTGTPRQVMERAEVSHTGRALADYVRELARLRTGAGASPGAATEAIGASTGQTGDTPGSGAQQYIDIHHAREHNLKGVDIRIPRNRLTVITGLSGSGKSTVAFDILFNEGQRRYLESLNAYARQFVQPAARPDVDSVEGIPPTVAIEQRTSRGGRKSTVATLTEVHHFLRLLYVRLGTWHCPACRVPIQAQTAEAIHAQLLREHRGETLHLLAPMVSGRKGIYKELARWAAGKGYASLHVDGAFLPTADWPKLDRYREHDIDLPVADLRIEPENAQPLRRAIELALEHGKGVLRIRTPDGALTTLSTERACPSCQRSFDEPDPRLFSYNSPHGWCHTCYGTGEVLEGFSDEDTGKEHHWRETESDEDALPVPCPTCDGARLNAEARAVTFQDRTLPGLSALTVHEARAWFADLMASRQLTDNPLEADPPKPEAPDHGAQGLMALTHREATIARDVLPEIHNRLRFLEDVGLGYLSLDRAAPTLSGGEAQRIRLAAQLGSNLQGVCYVMDEPTIGLHPRDNRLLLDVLGRLEGKGNTIVVVEHDEDTIRRAEHVIDLGPGAGINGGRVVAAGTVDELLDHPSSITGRYLRQPLPHPLLGERRPVQLPDAPGAAVPPPPGNAPEAPHATLALRSPTLHNLKGEDLHLPLGRLVVVTGVSGSGKSSLIRGVLKPALKRQLAHRRQDTAPDLPHCSGLEGWQTIDRVLEVDQTPIGKTPRSCPATYIGFWDDIRKLYAGTQEASLRGYGPGRFSFNTKDGRCPDCDGQGVRRVEMNFLPDVAVPCETCHGLRFTRETLAVEWKGRHIGDVLNMSVEEAEAFFAAQPRIHHPLTLLNAVGLGYLTLGQPSPTLSGGEAQRIKLVTELAKARPDLRAQRTPHTLYVLDEPTVGLHMADVERLIEALQRLVDAGHTVVVIEHNLDLIAEADWVVDIGPEGGDAGGRIVACGAPEQVAASATETGRYLGELLGRG